MLLLKGNVLTWKLGFQADKGVELWVDSQDFSRQSWWSCGQPWSVVERMWGWSIRNLLQWTLLTGAASRFWLPHHLSCMFCDLQLFRSKSYASL